MAVVIDNKFEIGQIVYLKTDKEQYPYIVLSFTVTKTDVMYGLQTGASRESFHYDFEITEEKNNEYIID